VRNTEEVASALDQIVADQGSYGSKDYNTFLSVIYTDVPSITQALVDQEMERRSRNLGVCLGVRGVRGAAWK
jgi:hypothetical protein